MPSFVDSCCSLKMNNKTRLSCCNEYYVDLIEPLFFDDDDKDNDSGKFSGVFCVRLLTCSVTSKSRNIRSKYVYVPAKFIDRDVKSYYKSNFHKYFSSNDIKSDEPVYDEADYDEENKLSQEDEYNEDVNDNQATVCESSIVSFNPCYYKKYKEIIARFPNPLKNLKAFSFALNKIKENYFVLQNVLTISENNADSEDNGE